ncbi:MAG: phosphotransferase [Planctomycetales bacterium]|nr:phosphotransferase [Planctomycetales bacterium]
MRLIDESSAADYLRESGRIADDERVRVRLLTGGVSNIVLRISFDSTEREDWVVKQAREQLRVADPWFCGVERIWREVETLRICADCLRDERQTDFAADDGFRFSVPQVVFEDRENYLYAMSAAPAEHIVWKRQLLRGVADRRIAAACGKLLGRLHARTWNDSGVANQLADRSFFEQLRVDPYYRFAAEQRPEFREYLEPLIASLVENRHSLVHGDFSPKNLLLFQHEVMLVDFEVGHFGDPAFDLGFFLTHIVLKAIHLGNREPEAPAESLWEPNAPADSLREPEAPAEFAPAPEAPADSTPASNAPTKHPTSTYLQLGDAFWNHYAQTMRPVIGDSAFTELERRAMLNLAGCLIARVDGKSKAEYLTDERQQEIVRQTARMIFAAPLSSWSEATASLHSR